MDAPFGDALAGWIRDNGGIVHLERRDEAEGGRGVVATRAVEHGARILAVPRTLLLTREIASETAAGAALTAAGIHASDGQFMLAVHLLAARREAGAWTPYTSALPAAAPDVPVGYDDADLALLEGSSMLARVYRERRLFHEQHETMTATVPWLAKCDFREFLWARTLVPSRAFALLGTEALVPMADMLNHRTAANVEWGYEHPTESFVMRALRSIAAGEAVHDSYGQKSNGLLLELYGFCVDDIERDEALIHLPPMDPVHPLARGTSTFGRTVRGERVFRVAHSTARAEEAMAITYLRRLLGTTAPLDADDARLRRVMVEACDRALAAFPTTIEQDDALLAGSTLGERARKCVRVRVGEKRALAAVRSRYASSTLPSQS